MRRTADVRTQSAAIARLVAAAVAPSAEAQQPTIATLASVARAVMAEYPNARVAVTVRRRDSLVFAQTYRCDASTGELTAGDTGAVVRIGSITKQFTAAAILQLVETGSIRLDDPITRWLPELAWPDADRITVRRLLEHRSGIPNDTGPPFADALAGRDPLEPRRACDASRRSELPDRLPCR